MSESVLIIGVLLALVVLVLSALVVVAVVLLLRVRRLAATVPGGGRAAYLTALIYTICPVDLLPDPIAADDIGVIGGALLYCAHLLRRSRRPPGSFEAGPRGVPGPPDRS